MDKIAGILIVVIVVTAFLALVLQAVIMGGEPSSDNGGGAATSTMQLTSSAFEHEGEIPAKYTCDGEDVNPPLEVTGVPEDAASLALIVDDPDAPTGTWVHWTVWNISATTTTFAEHATPEGAVEGVTSFGQSGYGGPCPPDGEHRYFFKIYALDVELDIDTEADKDVLEEAMTGHVLDKAELMGRYERTN